MSDSPDGGSPSLAERVARIEQRLDRIESTASAPPDHAGSATESPSGSAPESPAGSAPGNVPEARSEERDGGVFWALDGLRARTGDPGAVLFTGIIRLPGGERYEWQQAHPVDQQLADDWSQAAAVLAALAHPVRLLLLHEILLGARTTAELSGHERLGTTGQLYHHLRQLVAAGWLRSTHRGQYAVPPERIVPLLTVLAAARR
jgi:hypothetical protein